MPAYVPREVCAATRQTLTQRFPLAFRSQGSRDKTPLKAGIFRDIRARCPDLDPAAVKGALADYTGGPTYHRSLIAAEGGPRIDLDGNPVGTVKPGHVNWARWRLKRLEESWNRQQQAAE